MFTVCVGLVFRSKYVQFPIICSLQYSININTVEVDPHSDLLRICIVKPKNSASIAMATYCFNLAAILAVSVMHSSSRVITHDQQAKIADT